MRLALREISIFRPPHPARRLLCAAGLLLFAAGIFRGSARVKVVGFTLFSAGIIWSTIPVVVLTLSALGLFLALLVVWGQPKPVFDFKNNVTRLLVLAASAVLFTDGMVSIFWVLGGMYNLAVGRLKLRPIVLNCEDAAALEAQPKEDDEEEEGEEEDGEKKPDAS